MGRSLWNGQLESRVCPFQEKVSRLDRTVAEHTQFSLGVKELQDWMTDAVHLLDSYCHPTSDKSVLDSRMLKLEVGLLRKISLIDRIRFPQNSLSLHFLVLLLLRGHLRMLYLLRAGKPKHPESFGTGSHINASQK